MGIAQLYFFNQTKSLLFVLLCILALSLNSCKEPAAIEGHLSNPPDGSQVYLIDPGSFRGIAGSYFGKAIDTAIVNQDGSFFFDQLPQTTEPKLYELAVQQPGDLPNKLEADTLTKANYMPIVWQSNQHIEVNADYHQFQKSFSFENPSELNQALFELKEISQKAYEIHLAGKTWNVEGGKEVMEKEEAELRYKEVLMAFADETPHLLPAFVATRLVSPNSDYERHAEFLVRQCEKWKQTNAENTLVQELCALAEASKLPVLVGDQFPNVALPMITKDTVNLIEMLGFKITIIDLWASWCAPCRKENVQTLVPIWDQYHEQGVQIIAFALESNFEGWEAAVKKDGADRWLHASELQGDESTFLQRIRIRTIPANYILDENGVVIAKNVHGDELVAFVKSQLE